MHREQHRGFFSIYYYKQQGEGTRTALCSSLVEILSAVLLSTHRSPAPITSWLLSRTKSDKLVHQKLDSVLSRCVCREAERHMPASGVAAAAAPTSRGSTPASACQQTQSQLVMLHALQLTIHVSTTAACLCSWEDDNRSVGSDNGNESPSPASLARQASLPHTQSYVYRGAGLSVSAEQQQQQQQWQGMLAAVASAAPC
jgi:hypothetical protein